MTTEAKIRVMQPQVQECWKPLESEKVKKQILSLGLLREHALMLWAELCPLKIHVFKSQPQYLRI